MAFLDSSSSMLKKVLEGSGCAMLIQNSSGRRTKDSQRRHLGFAYCASSTSLRVFQQTARSWHWIALIMLHNVAPLPHDFTTNVNVSCQADEIGPETLCTHSRLPCGLRQIAFSGAYQIGKIVAAKSSRAARNGNSWSTTKDWRWLCALTRSAGTIGRLALTTKAS